MLSAHASEDPLKVAGQTLMFRALILCSLTHPCENRDVMNGNQRCAYVRHHNIYICKEVCYPNIHICKYVYMRIYVYMNAY